MCFNEEPLIIQVMSNRSERSYNINHYNLDWEPLDLARKNHVKTLKEIDIPLHLKTMINIAKILSNNTIYSRIDLYSIHGGIYFGEFTLYPVSGYMDFEIEETDHFLGALIDIENYIIK